jgi:hypothetical protein
VGRGRGWGVREEWGKEREMTQTLYAHMNKKKTKNYPKKNKKIKIRTQLQ